MTGRSPGWFKRFLLPGLGVKAVVIGGGYATGRELAEFFLSNGPWGGLYAILFATLLFSIFCALTFVAARRFGSYDYRSFFRRLLGPAWPVFELAYLLFVVLILAVLIPAVLAEEVEGVPFPNLRPEFGWRPAGARADELDGRDTRTVFYERRGERIGYTIVAGDAIDPPEDSTPSTVNDVDLSSLAEDGREIEDSPIPASDIAGLLELIENGTISSKIAKEVFDHMWAGEGAPAAIVEARGLKQVTDTGAIEATIDKIIAANPDKVAAAKDKPQAIGWFVGQVMRATQGQANPQLVNEVLKRKLEG